MTDGYFLLILRYGIKASLFTNTRTLKLKSWYFVNFQTMSGRKRSFTGPANTSLSSKKYKYDCNKFYAKSPSFSSWKEGDLPPSSSKRLTGMSMCYKSYFYNIVLIYVVPSMFVLKKKRDRDVVFVRQIHVALILLK